MPEAGEGDAPYSGARGAGQAECGELRDVALAHAAGFAGAARRPCFRGPPACDCDCCREPVSIISVAAVAERLSRIDRRRWIFIICASQGRCSSAPRRGGRRPRTLHGCSARSFRPLPPCPLASPAMPSLSLNPLDSPVKLRSGNPCPKEAFREASLKGCFSHHRLREYHGGPRP